MKINSQKCVACGNCTYVCPMGAIYIDPVNNRATVNRDECVFVSTLSRTSVQQRRLSGKNSFGHESFGERSPIRVFRMSRPGLKAAEQRKSRQTTLPAG